ncbi:hypothetical protein CC80DRAFT_554869 [Byssothecium circinans]|uniref:RING-type domain-containing protein n=1 Tax=Byssothecium circinans TaxID=147558 RepID=A0A6A5TCF3_9PLEO|nr:hypothetical protein CC80DRAFT_554869 [Byssothecium circinans]
MPLRPLMKETPPEETEYRVFGKPTKISCTDEFEQIMKYVSGRLLDKDENVGHENYGKPVKNVTPRGEPVWQQIPRCLRLRGPTRPERMALLCAKLKTIVGRHARMEKDGEDVGEDVGLAHSIAIAWVQEYFVNDEPAMFTAVVEDLVAKGHKELKKSKNTHVEDEGRPPANAPTTTTAQITAQPSFGDSTTATSKNDSSPMSKRSIDDFTNNGLPSYRPLRSSGNCAICQDPLSHPTKAAITLKGCEHHFHKSCIMAWVTAGYSSSNSCPNCHTKLFDAPLPGQETKGGRRAISFANTLITDEYMKEKWAARGSSREWTNLSAFARQKYLSDMVVECLYRVGEEALKQAFLDTAGFFFEIILPDLTVAEKSLLSCWSLL